MHEIKMEEILIIANMFAKKPDLVEKMVAIYEFSTVKIRYIR